MFYNKRIFQRCFYYPKKYWYRNIKNIPLYFKLMHDLIKHGYDEYSTWETFRWFTYTMREILERYKKSRDSSPYLKETDPEENHEEWDKILDNMINLLNLMDEDNPRYKNENSASEWKWGFDERDKAKDEFFKLFSQYFWDFWD